MIRDLRLAVRTLTRSPGYAVAYLVAPRGHEIAIRMAPGAGRSAVLGLVLAQGMKLALVGVALGRLGATRVAPIRTLRAE